MKCTKEKMFKLKIHLYIYTSVDLFLVSSPWSVLGKPCKTEEPVSECELGLFFFSVCISKHCFHTDITDY